MLKMAGPGVMSAGVEQRFSLCQQLPVRHIPQVKEPRGIVVGIGHNTACYRVATGSYFGHGVPQPLAVHHCVAIGRGNDAIRVASGKQPVTGFVHQQSPNGANVRLWRGQLNLGQPQGEIRVLTLVAFGQLVGVIRTVICQQQDFIAGWIKWRSSGVNLLS
ncbi:hypothetical protein GCM10027190_25390 [Spirosoma areae]